MNKEAKDEIKEDHGAFSDRRAYTSMAGCAGNGSKDKKEGSAGNEAQEPVKIATKPMTEQFILGEMLKKLIEEKAGYEVELTKVSAEERAISSRQMERESLISIRNIHPADGFLCSDIRQVK